MHWAGLTPLAVAGLVAALGRWGRARADLLVPPHFRSADRERRIASVRRGGLACYVAALVLAAAAVLAVV